MIDHGGKKEKIIESIFSTINLYSLDSEEGSILREEKPLLNAIFSFSGYDGVNGISF